jgi:hypothetical protein
MPKSRNFDQWPEEDRSRRFPVEDAFLETVELGLESDCIYGSYHG